MATVSTTPDIRRSPNQTFVLYLKEMKYEFLKNLRIPRYSASVVVLPLMFYVLFGLFMGRQTIGNTSTAAYLIATYGTFGVLGASLFGTAASLASERGLGWIQVKKASPMPPFAYFAAKFFMGMMFSFIVVSLLLVLGWPSAGCVCRSKTWFSLWERWSQVQSLSVPWDWRWVILWDRTQRPP